jgi:guanylate kinase
MGKLLIFSAPSGSGKTTIVGQVLKKISGLEFSVSACSRAPRAHEINGKDYYFLTADEFRKKINDNEFIEWEEVYENQYYGTLKSEVERIWANGNHVVFDVDVVGGLNIKKQFPENALAIFIQAPSIDILRQRLINRGTETEEQINKRIAKAEYEMGFAEKFDTVIINDVLETAVNQTIHQIEGFLKTT